MLKKKAKMKDSDLEGIYNMCAIYKKYKKMEEVLKKIQKQDVPFEIDTTLHLECREMARKALSYDPLHVYNEGMGKQCKECKSDLVQECQSYQCCRHPNIQFGSHHKDVSSITCDVCGGTVTNPCHPFNQ